MALARRPHSRIRPRSYEIAVAGPAALLVAKATKIKERNLDVQAGKRDRVDTKDAVDCLRLLTMVDPRRSSPASVCTQRRRGRGRQRRNTHLLPRTARTRRSRRRPCGHPRRARGGRDGSQVHGSGRRAARQLRARRIDLTDRLLDPRPCRTCRPRAGWTPCHQPGRPGATLWVYGNRPGRRRSQGVGHHVVLPGPRPFAIRHRKRRTSRHHLPCPA